MQLVRAISRMHVSPNLMLVENDLYPADDPLVVAHPDWFTDDLEPILHRTGTPDTVEITSYETGKKGNAIKRTTATQPMVEAR